jgi:hypothetical protein
MFHATPSPRPSTRRTAFHTLAAAAATLAFAVPSTASTTGVTQHAAKDPRIAVPGSRPAGANQHPLAGTSLSPYYSATGLVTLSIDALGTNDPAGGEIRVNKPSDSATVRAAYLMAASTGFCSCGIGTGEVSLAGNPITWDLGIPNTIFSNNYIADVTGIVAGIVNPAPAGLTNLHVDETNTLDVDGEILAVVFDDPTLTQNFTAVVFFGAQNVLGDDFAITLADPADPTNPDYKLDLSLGISYSYQTDQVQVQFSLVDVDGQRMTSSAGGQDDGQAENGALITAGGIGDSNANPADPNAPPADDRYDDELYDLRPFVNTGDTLINLHTINPSNDDNIMFAGLVVSGAAVVGEGVVLTPIAATNPVGSVHTVTATLVTDLGDPITGREVDFAVLTGPNAGTNGSVTSDLNGQAQFSYTGLVVGEDTIQASFLNEQSLRIYSNIVTKDWTLFTAFCFGDNKGFPCPCGNNGAPGNGCANSDHPGGANFFASGVASIANDSLVLTCKDQHASSLTLFWQGDTQIDPIQHGDGIRCVSGLRRLYRAKNQHEDTVSAPPGTGQDENASVSQRSAALGDPLSAGATRYYFATYRDPVDFACVFPATMNDSNAIAIIWVP